MRSYDIVVIGAGPGGYEAALKLAEAGKKSLLIDRSKARLGGTCLNEGCISAKAYLQSAEYVAKVPHFSDCGVALEFKGLDMACLGAKTVALKDEIRSGVAWLLEQAGVETLYGSARFTAANSVEVEGETIGFEKCIIATGSAVRESALLPLDGKRIISSSEVFELTVMPASLVIVGGGPIACEFATFFSAFGVEVTMVVRGGQLLSSEDEDVAKALLRAFKKRNIRVVTNAVVKNAEVKEAGVELLVASESEESIKSELVLSAIGRVPYTEGLEPERAGVAQDEKGFIVVNDAFETSQENIYAVGDCINTLAFAHTAYAEARIVAQNIISGASAANTHVTPSTIFSDPAVATCGLREKEASAQGRAVEVKKAFFKANAKAKIEGDDSGFAKIVVCAESGVVLGAAVIGVEATEIIHELVLAVEKQLSAAELKHFIHAHPSVSEIVSYL